MGDRGGAARVPGMRPGAWIAVAAAMLVTLPAVGAAQEGVGPDAGSPVGQTPADQTPAEPEPTRPTDALTWIGEVLTPVTAREDSDPEADVVTVVQPLAPLGGAITALEVLGSRNGADGRLWVRVLLPKRPNGTTGWVPAERLRLTTTPFRIRIDLGDRMLTLFRSGRPLRRFRVAVGTAQNPTPRGRFALAEIILTHSPGAFLGPVVMPLTGFSETLNEYEGGNGRVAVHGTSLPELIGTRASHGCIRLHNRDVVRLARIVRPGTPVVITA